MNACVFENETECNALKEKQCADCPFRKTKEELLTGRKNAVTRIDNLPDHTRRHIIRKYYGSMKAFVECSE